MTVNPARSSPVERRADARRQRNPTVESAIRSRGDVIRQQELERALGRFEAAGECSPEQRAILESMANAIVDGILATPVGVLESAPADDPALQTTIELFDPPQ